MKWVDVNDIAIELADNHPEIDPLTISFPALMKLVSSLPEFDDEDGRCGEKILEAIQMAWIEERD
ncbi:MAG: Fe-S cluster assembly protein IscX [Pontibacterium sp.]